MKIFINLYSIQSVEDELGDSGRVILRPSGTEPLIRVTLEGIAEFHVKRLAEQLAEVVRRARQLVERRVLLNDEGVELLVG